jgi:all-trans-retinol 13,14-reductase
MKQYDFLIIGSGMAGLTCGYTLAKEGFSVCILEKNRQFGGNLQTFSRDKTVFDTGVHYLGGLDKGQNLNRYFKYFGIMDELKLIRLDENGYDKITFNNDPIEYPHSIGHENFIENLVKLFPNSREELVHYCKVVKEVCDSIPLYGIVEADYQDIHMEYLTKSASDFIKETITEPRLRDVLIGANMLYAGIEGTTTLYQHAVVVNHYIESAYKLIDGGSQITKLMVRNIKALGGELFNYSTVCKLEVDNKTVSYVECDNGERYYAKNIISNVHPGVTMGWVDTGVVRESYRARLQNLENSIGAFSLHLVFHPETFPYLNHNYYYHHTQNIWTDLDYKNENWPHSVLAVVPASSRSKNYAESMTLMTYMRWADVEKWGDTFNTIPRHEADRGQEYADFKANKIERLMRHVEKMFPGIGSKVRSYHTSTPLSYRDYIATPQGSIYGIVKDSGNPIGTFISHRSKLSNLFFTGQNMSTHGILGVTISGIRTSAEFIGQNELIRKINAVTG